MLEFDDIQHILLTRTPALTGRYEFLSFRSASGGRAWLSGVLKTIQSAADVLASVDEDKRWVTVAFTWNGLKALGVDETSLATFPEEFKQGMPARADILGDTGANHPDNWVGGLASPDLHAIAILFARDEGERERCNTEHQRFLADCEGVEVLSSLDLLAIPPFDTAHDHFGYRDRLSQPVIEGTDDVPTPGSGPPLKPGEFILGYPDESGRSIDLPQPEILSRNGSYMAYRRLQEHVGKFRDFLRQHGETPEEQELVAAKLMGRWRSGAPLVLAPDEGRSCIRRRHAAKQQLQLQRDGSAWVCGTARFPHASHEPSRHCSEHKPTSHDSPRRYLWFAFARRRSRRWHRPRHSSFHHLCKPYPTV